MREECTRDTYFMISLSLMIFLISAIRTELTHTMERPISSDYGRPCKHRTLFPDKGVVAVVGIVCISRSSTSSIAKGTEIEL